MNNINTVINNDFIASLNPCSDRHNNYLRHYRGKSFSVEEFVELPKITYGDKFWVLWNHDFLTIKQKRELACDFAEHVLPIFESNYPDDERPRKAIECARNTIAAPDAADAYAYADAADAYADAADARAAAYGSERRYQMRLILSKLMENDHE